MKRSFFCVFLCLFVFVGLLSGCGREQKDSRKDKTSYVSDSTQTVPVSEAMLGENREHLICDFTYEADGNIYPIRQVMEIQRKGVPPTSVKAVYGTDHTVSVRFDANGGHFSSNLNVIGQVDAFNIKELSSDEDGIVSLAPLDPSDDRRVDSAHDVQRIEHMLVGWYTLDENGNKRMWDFETDRVTVDANGSYTVNEPVLTLYAMWSPLASVEYYDVDEPDELLVVEWFSFNGTIKLPAWDETTGTMKYNGFPKETRKFGYTIKAVYYDAAKTRPVTEPVITHPATAKADGTVENLVLKLYIEYIEDDE